MNTIDGSQEQIPLSAYVNRSTQVVKTFFFTAFYGAGAGLTLGLNEKTNQLAINAFKDLVYHTYCLFNDPRPLADRLITKEAKSELNQLGKDIKNGASQFDKLFGGNFFTTIVKTGENVLTSGVKMTENLEKELIWNKFCGRSELE